MPSIVVPSKYSITVTGSGDSVPSAGHPTIPVIFTGITSGQNSKNLSDILRQNICLNKMKDGTNTLKPFTSSAFVSMIVNTKKKSLEVSIMVVFLRCAICNVWGSYIFAKVKTGKDIKF